MLIPDRKIALARVRDTIAEILVDGTGNGKLQSQAVAPNAHVNFYLLSSYIHHMTDPVNEMLQKAKSLKNHD